MSSCLKVLLYASYFSVFVPLTMYLLKVRRLSKSIHIIGVLVIISGICDLVGFMLFTQKLSTALVINIFFTAQFCLLSYYYYETFFKNKYDVVLILSVIQFFIAFLIITFFYQGIQREHQTMMWTVSSLMLIAYGIMFSRDMQRVSSPLYAYGHFWINGGVLLYFSASLWLFVVTSDTVMGSITPGLGKLLWRFHDVNNVVKNVTFAIGIYYASKTVTSRIEFESKSDGKVKFDGEQNRVLPDVTSNRLSRSKLNQ